MSMHPAYRLPTLCALGLHRPNPMARWNNGYYFARCQRCGHDLIRTAFERWHLPRGFKVVWQAEPPRDARGDAMTLAPVATSVRSETVAAREGAMPDTDPEAVSDVRTAPDLRSLAQSGALFGGQQVEFPIRERPPQTAHALSDATREHEQAGANDEPPMRHEDERDEVPFFDEPEPGNEDLRGHDPFGEALSPVEPVLTVDPSPPVELGRAELPIQQVLRDLQQRAPAIDPADPFDADGDGFSAPDFMRSAPIEEPAAELDMSVAQLESPAAREPAPPVTGRTAPPRRVYPVIPDFMDEPGASVWDFDAPPADPEPPPPARTASGTNWKEQLRRTSGELSASGGRLLARAAVLRDRGARAVVVGDASMDSSLAAGLLARPLAVASLVLVGGLALVAAVVDGRRNVPARAVEAVGAVPAIVAAPGSPRTPDASARRAASTASATSQAFVTANLLNCRASPRNDAETLRRLSRGAPVRILGIEPGWVGVAHQGRQCWVAAQHLSTNKPA